MRVDAEMVGVVLLAQVGAGLQQRVVRAPLQLLAEPLDAAAANGPLDSSSQVPSATVRSCLCRWAVSGVRPRIGPSFLGAGNHCGDLGPKREVLLSFVCGQLVQLARVAHAGQVGVHPPECECLPSVVVGRGVAVE